MARTPAAKSDDNGSVSTELANPGTRFSDEQLLAVDSFDAALELLANEGVVIDHAEETLGNGFAILKDKGLLCGVELLFLSWQFNNGDNGEFVSANVIARMPGQKTPSKFVVNDGSTGIRDQLKLYTKKTGKTAGLHAKRGFTRSDYTYTDETTKETKGATTFYIDTSAS